MFNDRYDVHEFLIIGNVKILLAEFILQMIRLMRKLIPEIVKVFSVKIFRLVQ